MAEPSEAPNGPVVLIHLMTPDGALTACSGRPWKAPSDDAYRGVPRMLCPACHLVLRTDPPPQPCQPTMNLLVDERRP